MIGRKHRPERFLERPEDGASPGPIGPENRAVDVEQDQLAPSCGLGALEG
jgi:hypothetical protein